MTIPCYPVPCLDTALIARVRDALLDGDWADQAERELAEEAERQFPGVTDMVGRAQAFHVRAAKWVVEQGAVAVVFGAVGYPVPGVSLHAAAQRARTRVRRARIARLRMEGMPLEDAVAAAWMAFPPAKFVYADANPDCALVNKAMVAGYDRHAAACMASIRDPEGLLGSPEVVAAGTPVSVQLQLSAHYWPDDAAASILARYARLLSPGSSVVLSLWIPSAEEISRMRPAAGVRIYRHTTADVASWIAEAGMTLHSQGITDVRTFERSWAQAEFTAYREGQMVGAVALVG